MKKNNTAVLMFPFVLFRLGFYYYCDRLQKLWDQNPFKQGHQVKLQKQLLIQYSLLLNFGALDAHCTTHPRLPSNAAW